MSLLRALDTNHRVIEIDRQGNGIWRFGETGVPGGDDNRLDGPRNAVRLASGNTLNGDSRNSRVLEVDAEGTMLRE